MTGYTCWVLTVEQVDALKAGEPICRVYRRAPGNDPGEVVRAQAQGRPAWTGWHGADERDIYIEVLARVWRQYGKGQVRPRFEAFVMVRKAPDDHEDVLRMKAEDQARREGDP